MSKKLRVSSEDREALVRGEVEEFPIYTTQLLNLANQNAQSSRAEHVGKMSAIISEFEKEYPEGTYDDWVDFYMERYDGEEKLENSADMLHDKVEQMREAMNQINRDMAYRFLHQLVLYKTYMGNGSDIEELVIKKLEQVYSKNVERTHESEVTGYLGDVPFVVESFENTTNKPQPENFATVYFREERDNSIIIDTHDIDRVLGTTISDDEQAHRRIDNFSLI